MESLGKILQGLKVRQQSFGPLEPDLESKCPGCGGRGWVSRGAPVGDPDFGKAFPCRDCVTGPQNNADWFGGLDIKPGNTEAVELCRAMARNPSGWLVLHGNVGTGKTTLAKAILSQWRGQETEPQTSAEILMQWRGVIMSPAFESIFETKCAASTAVIDDLGAERVNRDNGGESWVLERLTAYLNYRYQRHLPTVITINCNSNELTRHLDARIADRVFGQGTGLVRVVTLDVESFRKGEP